MRAGADAGPNFVYWGRMFVFWGPCWASFLCSGADAGRRVCVLGPMLGFIFVCWGRRCAHIRQLCRSNDCHHLYACKHTRHAGAWHALRFRHATHVRGIRAYNAAAPTGMGQVCGPYVALIFVAGLRACCETAWYCHYEIIKILDFLSSGSTASGTSLGQAWVSRAVVRRHSCIPCKS